MTSTNTFEPPPEDEVSSSFDSTFLQHILFSLATNRLCIQLAAASVADVCEILASMNLQRYTEAFIAEQISGVEFLELDEEMLKGRPSHSNILTQPLISMD
jgi:hypothetical protein